MERVILPEEESYVRVGTWVCANIIEAGGGREELGCPKRSLLIRRCSCPIAVILLQPQRPVKRVPNNGSLFSPFLIDVTGRS